MRECLLGLLLLSGCSPPRTPTDIQREIARSLTPVGVSASSPESRGPVTRARVRFYADHDYRSHTLRWEQRLETLVRQSNEILGRDLGLELVVGDRRPWERKSSGDDLAASLGELEALDQASDVDWVVGLVSALPGATSSVHHLGMARTYGRHFVVRGMDDIVERQAIETTFDKLPAEEREQLYSERRAHKVLTVFLHELGHTLGALHTRDAQWVMSPIYDHLAHAFCPPNLELMRLGLEWRDRAAREPSDRRRWQDAYAATVERSSFGGWDARDREAVLHSRGAKAGAGPDAAGVALSALDREGFDLVVGLARKGQLADAMPTLTRLESRNGESPEVARLACWVRVQLDRRGRAALDACRHATSLLPDDPLATLGLADALAAGGGDGEAKATELLAHTRELIVAEPQPRPDLWQYHASLCRMTSLVTWAEEGATRAGEPAFGAEVVAWATQLRRRAGLPKDAVRYKVEPRAEAGVIADLRQGYTELGRPAAAARRATNLLARYPGLPGALSLRCQAAVREGKAAARGDCEAAVSAYPEGSLAQLALALVLRRSGDQRAAIEHLERAVALDAELSEAWLELERAYVATGQEQRAAEVRRRRAGGKAAR
jgi:hypothetical protein